MEKEIAWLLKEKYHGKPGAKFTRDALRVKNGEPLDYIIGFADFLGCKIDLSKKPLIPRFETEFWVEQVIESMSAKKNNLVKEKIMVLDMFAGSGCIGLAVLKHIQNSVVMFADSEKNCIEQIAINGKINGIDKKRYVIIKSDVFENIQGTFDYIFANPPYIPEEKKMVLQKSVIDFEPHVALFGDNDGLGYIRKFLALAKDFLTENGKIYMEFDTPQKPAIQKLLKKLKYRSWEFCKDQYGKTRYVVVG